MPGVRITRPGFASEHTSCVRPTYRPNVSGVHHNDHRIVEGWRKRVRTRCMPLILRVARLTPWGLVVGRCWLELKIDCVVVGVVGNWLLLMPDRIRSLLPEPAIFGPRGPLL